MEDYISHLNQQQRDAVLYTDGPQLVIAGAGSGKTRVLTYKIVHLLSHGYEPWRVMALTFTNKAAREMRERIRPLVGETTAARLWMGTFHSIFARILRSNADRIGFKGNFTIYDTADSKSLVKSIIKDLDLDDKVYKPSTVLSSISSAKNALISPEAYSADRDIIEADRRSRRPRTAEIYRIYCLRCKVAGAMDFDDLLYYTNILLRDNPDILHHYQDFFRYILVDEYQDTNFAQHLIVTQLCQGSKHLCVVGDDAQSIYSFRGANIRNILNLKRAYPDLSIFKLEQNYRSTQNIINAANSLIEKNTEQMPKHVFSRNDTGDRIEVVKCYSDFEEAYMVANRISQVRMRSKDSYEEFAVLYRTNAQSRVLEESLRKRNIPYRIYGGLTFYQRKEIKDAISYFRLSVNPDDDEALKRVINYPARGIGDTTVKKLVAAAIEHKVSIWGILSDPDKYPAGINNGTRRKLNDFHKLIESFISLDSQGKDADESARHIISSTGLLTMFISDRTPESVSKQENLQELLNGVKQFVEEKREAGDDGSISMAHFLGEVSLATDQDQKDQSEGEKVTLMTIHSAKGLEFGNVFIVGAEEDLMPSAMSAGSWQEIEEERRLLYVAITRAKKFCMISYASSRFINGKTKTPSPSRFLSDINRKYLLMSTGASIAGGTRNPAEDYRSSYHSFHSSDDVKGSLLNNPASASRQTIMMPFSGQRHKPEATVSGVHQASELSAGMVIEHPRFGKGTIIQVDSSQADARIVVDFANVDRKTLLLKFAKFNILKQ